MSITEDLQGFGETRVGEVRGLVSAAAPQGVDASLILAMGHRETGLRNIVGDQGHGRGWLQIDDRWHADWLGAQKGCRSGSWRPEFSSALPKGRVPSLSAATHKAFQLLRENLDSARRNGVPGSSRLRFAVAAYNCGAGNALKGFRGGDVDRHTANGKLLPGCF